MTTITRDYAYPTSSGIVPGVVVDTNANPTVAIDPNVTTINPTGAVSSTLGVGIPGGMTVNAGHTPYASPLLKSTRLSPDNNAISPNLSGSSGRAGGVGLGRGGVAGTYGERGPGPMPVGATGIGTSMAGGGVGGGGMTPGMGLGGVTGDPYNAAGVGPRSSVGVSSAAPGGGAPGIYGNGGGGVGGHVMPGPTSGTNAVYGGGYGQPVTMASGMPVPGPGVGSSMGRTEFGSGVPPMTNDVPGAIGGAYPAAPPLTANNAVAPFSTTTQPFQPQMSNAVVEPIVIERTRHHRRSRDRSRDYDYDHDRGHNHDRDIGHRHRNSSRHHHSSRYRSPSPDSPVRSPVPVEHSYVDRDRDRHIRSRSQPSRARHIEETPEFGYSNSRTRDRGAGDAMIPPDYVPASQGGIARQSRSRPPGTNPPGAPGPINPNVGHAGTTTTAQPQLQPQPASQDQQQLGTQPAGSAAPVIVQGIEKLGEAIAQQYLQGKIDGRLHNHQGHHSSSNKHHGHGHSGREYYDDRSRHRGAEHSRDRDGSHHHRHHHTSRHHGREREQEYDRDQDRYHRHRNRSASRSRAPAVTTVPVPAPAPPPGPSTVEAATGAAPGITSRHRHRHRSASVSAYPTVAQVQPQGQVMQQPAMTADPVQMTTTPVSADVGVGSRTTRPVYPRRRSRSMPPVPMQRGYGYPAAAAPGTIQQSTTQPMMIPVNNGGIAGGQQQWAVVPPQGQDIRVIGSTPNVLHRSGRHHRSRSVQPTFSPSPHVPHTYSPWHPLTTSGAQYAQPPPQPQSGQGGFFSRLFGIGRRTSANNPAVQAGQGAVQYAHTGRRHRRDSY